MPEDDYVWLPREDVLQFEEISALVDVFLALGVDKVRLTGGEPLLRRDLPTLVRDARREAGLEDLALTTNGVLLADQIDALEGRRAAPHHGQPRHAARAIASSRSRASMSSMRVHAGIAAAQRVFGRLKIDTVVIRGVNDDELIDADRVRRIA